MEFQESLLQESHTDSVKHVKNLDKFFKSMYDYYAAKGIGAIILSQFCAVTSLGFTIVFSSFLMAFVDWTALLHCHDEESCHGLNGNLLKDPFHHTPTMASFFVFVYFSLFSGFWVWKCMAAMEIISDALDMSSFYREKLGLRLVDLQHMQWYEVLERLILLHERGAYIVAVKEKLTVHDVVMRIMRKENYLIGMINKNALDLFIPWWIPFASERFLTKSIEWALHFCILDYMFDEQFDVSSEFLNDVAGLQWRFQVVGLIHLLLLPFMLIFMTVHFFLQNAQHFHSSRAYLGPRQWSPLALWKFREFNELPHIFEERINKSYKPANEYISGFHNPYTEIVARCLTYIAGAFVATLLLISVLSDGALLYVHMGDYNLLWYLGIFSALYAGARSLIPDEPQDPESSANLLRKTCAHTHYFPPHWDQQASSVEVKDEMCSLYQYKGQIFLMEILSVVLTPVVLCFSLPACAHTVLDFIRNHSRYIEGVGAVCDFSLFDLERYGDDDYGAEKNGFLAKSHRPNDGKLEKSLLNFQQAHPNFNGGEASRALFSRLSTFKDMKRNQRDQLLASAIMDKSVVYSASRFAGADPHLAMPTSPIISRERGTIPRRGKTLAPIRPALGAPGIALPQEQTEREMYGAPRDGFGAAFIAESGGEGSPSSRGEDDGAFAHAFTLTNPAVAVSPPPLGLGEQSQGEMKMGSVQSLEQSFESPGGSALEDKSGEMSPLLHNNTVRRSHGGDIGMGMGMGMGMNHIELSGMSEMSGMRQQNNFNRSLFESHRGGFQVSQQESRTDLPSVLRSILRQENIDYENDFYWLTKFQDEHQRDPAQLERSLLSPHLAESASASAYTSAYSALQQQMAASGTGVASPGPFAQSHINAPSYMDSVPPFTARSQGPESPYYYNNTHGHRSVSMMQRKSLGGLDRLAESELEESV